MQAPLPTAQHIRPYLNGCSDYLNHHYSDHCGRVFDQIKAQDKEDINGKERKGKYANL